MDYFRPDIAAIWLLPRRRTLMWKLFLNFLPKEQRNLPAAAGEFRCHSLHSVQILIEFNVTVVTAAEDL